MIKRIFTIIILSILLTSIVNAKIIFDEEISGVHSDEWVTKKEVIDFISSMSEILQTSTDIDTLIPKFEKNPALKRLSSEGNNKIEE